MPDDSPASPVVKTVVKEVEVPVPVAKPWYESRTVWLNLIAVIVLMLQTITGFVVSPAEQMAILAVLNLVLRAITNTGLSE